MRTFRRRKHSTISQRGTDKVFAEITLVKAKQTTSANHEKRTRNLFNYTIIILLGAQASHIVKLGRNLCNFFVNKQTRKNPTQKWTPQCKANGTPEPCFVAVLALRRSLEPVLIFSDIQLAKSELKKIGGKRKIMSIN